MSIYWGNSLFKYLAGLPRGTRLEDVDTVDGRELYRNAQNANRVTEFVTIIVLVSLSIEVAAHALTVEIIKWSSAVQLLGAISLGYAGFKLNSVSFVFRKCLSGWEIKEVLKNQERTSPLRKKLRVSLLVGLIGFVLVVIGRPVTELIVKRYENSGLAQQGIPPAGKSETKTASKDSNQSIVLPAVLSNSGTVPVKQPIVPAPRTVPVLSNSGLPFGHSVSSNAETNHP
jgi:hypothetical protein